MAAINREAEEGLVAAFLRVLHSGNFILGEEVDSFETSFAEYCGCRFAIGVGNGYDALTLVLRAMDIGPGDEVIVPVHTFIATWLSVSATGATIVPVDVDPWSLTLTEETVRSALNERTAAIVPVHIYGFPVSVGALHSIAQPRGLPIVGDAAQAHGASIGGCSVGALGDAAAFSFYPAKNLGALGDGGAVTTNDTGIAQRVTRLRNYGSRSKYDFVEVGVNSRLDPLQAAFLGVKLRQLDRWNERRGEIAARYLSGLNELPGLLLPALPPPGSRHAWYAFCIRTPSRDALQGYLRDRGIETQVYYPTPPHLSEAFSHLGYRRGAFPVSESAAAEGLALPIGHYLTDGEVERIVYEVRRFFN